MLGLPWELLDDNAYELACQACEILVQVATEEIRQKIRTVGVFTYRKGKRGRGRELMNEVEIGGLVLKPGDRLEPSASLLDVAKFNTKAIPFEAIFWRPHFDTRGALVVRGIRRNPLF